MLDSAGFEIEKVEFDSDLSSFLRSEEYKNKMTIFDKNSYQEKYRFFYKKNNMDESIFNKEQIKIFREKLEKLNNENLGDHAIFLLKMC
ncbi:MAG: hypothetical protein LBB45_00610 [Methanobrevibacter sp.]|nr:hypothetical protein [Candidatus Methanovirga basalitermitum]